MHPNAEGHAELSVPDVGRSGRRPTLKARWRLSPVTALLSGSLSAGKSEKRWNARLRVIVSTSREVKNSSRFLPCLRAALAQGRSLLLPKVPS